MYKTFVILALLLFSIDKVTAAPKPFVICNLHGPLGHQMFQVAAAVVLAKDNHARALFPDLATQYRDQISTHCKNVFFRLDTSAPSKQPNHQYLEKGDDYVPIPYAPNMRINGFFQSENYFVHRKELIQELFAPSSDILEYLQSKYGDVIADPKSVAIHVQKKPQGLVNQTIYAAHDKSYVTKAIALFPDDYHFYVFSDDIDWCQKSLSNLATHISFVQTPSIYHDLFLQSLCQHNIISNTTYAWWAAWLNKNPGKVVIAPRQWFVPGSEYKSKDLIPAGWYQLND